MIDFFWGKKSFSYDIVFKDRKNAGKILGKNLKCLIKSNKLYNSNLDIKPNIIIIGVLKGGLLLANEVSKILGATMDVIYPRRIVADDHETTIGSVLFSNLLFNVTNNDLKADKHFLIQRNEDIISQLKISDKYVQNQIKLIIDDISKDYQIYHKDITTNIQGNTIILIDDGVYSGATASIALQWIRQQKPYKLVFATPISPLEIIYRLKKDPKIFLDYAEVIKMPKLCNYKTVDYYYKYFEDIPQITIDKIIQDAMTNKKFNS